MYKTKKSARFQRYTTGKGGENTTIKPYTKVSGLNLVYPDPNFGKLKIDHQSSRAFRYHSRPISKK